jgi:hypothetical protein
MTSQSPRIYTYKITFEEVPYYYYGSKKEKQYNQEYWGSPKTNKWCWELYTPKKQILELFEFSDDGYEECRKVEDRLIKPVLNDPWCLNERCGGNFSIKHQQEAGKKGGLSHKQNGTGFFKLTKEERSELSKECGKKGGKISKELGKGIHGRTKEQMTEDGKRGGVIGGKNASSQKWICTETGFITNSGCLSQYQKARGIETSKRVRIS